MFVKSTEKFLDTFEKNFSFQKVGFCLELFLTPF
eukprot:UN13570